MTSVVNCSKYSDFLFSIKYHYSFPPPFVANVKRLSSLNCLLQCMMQRPYEVIITATQYTNNTGKGDEVVVTILQYIDKSLLTRIVR